MSHGKGKARNAAEVSFRWAALGSPACVIGGCDVEERASGKVSRDGILALPCHSLAL